MDVCATSENAKCKKYYGPEEDGLKQEWKGVCWMNPPYGREGDWKMDEEGLRISLCRRQAWFVWGRQELIRPGGLTTALRGNSGLLKVG